VGQDGDFAANFAKMSNNQKLVVYFFLVFITLEPRVE